MTATQPLKPDASAVDRFVAGRIAIGVAFVWGLAEATVLVFVPDILLSAMGSRALRPALKATLAALAGALLGGAAMYLLGKNFPDTARSLLVLIPAINSSLIESVENQLVQDGLVAVLLGPTRGIPYKIYAVEWGAFGNSFLPFFLISIPARCIRFLLGACAARVIARLIEPWTHRSVRIEMLILVLVWIAFYTFYFARFGW